MTPKPQRRCQGLTTACWCVYAHVGSGLWPPQPPRTQSGRPAAVDIDNGVGDTQLLVLLITPG